MTKRWWEDPVSWLCDYGLFVFGLFFVILLGLWRWQNGQASPVLIPAEVTPTIFAGTVTTTPRSNPVNTASASVFPPSGLSETPTTPTSVPIVSASAKPDFVLVILPLNWHSSAEDFQRAAQNQADTFVRESHIDSFFNPKIIILPDGLQAVSLSSDDVVYEVLEFGLQKKAGDRYIGLTDGNISLRGNDDIVGWTSGGQAAVAENGDPYVVAHEMGHTFSLCDEYSYGGWSQQNAEMNGGCPNPYPTDCPRTERDRPTCDGAPTEDGRNSIMGPAGLNGAYGFNTACLSHLQDVFAQLSGVSP